MTTVVDKGSLTLTLATVEPGNTATYEIDVDGMGGYVPEWTTDERGVVIKFPGGRLKIWPWANLLTVDFVPPVRRPTGET